MMSMDAVLNRGFKLANYCDTSGNPPASKVYRAAKIILSQPGIRGYFASGSGVASQEQYHSARGLVKAFHEENLAIPAVIRLGGNFEEKAIEILAAYLKKIPGVVEGYGRDDAPESCAARLEELVNRSPAAPPRGPAARRAGGTAERLCFRFADGATVLRPCEVPGLPDERVRCGLRTRDPQARSRPPGPRHPSPRTPKKESAPSAWPARSSANSTSSTPSSFIFPFPASRNTGRKSSPRPRPPGRPGRRPNG